MQQPMDGSQVLRIEPAEAKTRFDRAEAAFVDVRPQEAYAQSHIPGALSLPLGKMPHRYRELPRDRLLILY